MFDRSKTYTVYQLNTLIKTQLEEQFFYCSVEGEISNLARPQSGHLYFSLKDAQSVLKAVLWRSVAQKYDHLMENGAKVSLRGSISLYQPRGEYQLIVNHVEPYGVGNLYLQYEALKRKLEQEGLFSDQHKKAVKLNPQKIGIVTSESAAALQDVLNVLSHHRPDIPYKIYPCYVQGDLAVNSIVSAIEKANSEQEVELLLIVRGGGSIEDLWAFNEEKVARAVFNSSIPTISGVGHETDHTIIDYIADMRGATPSVAAKLSSISAEQLCQYIDQMESELKRNLVERIHRKAVMLEKQKSHLLTLDPEKILLKSKNRVEQLEKRLVELIGKKIAKERLTLVRTEGKLSPEYLAKAIGNLRYQLQQNKEGMIRLMDYRFNNVSKRLSAEVGRLEALSPLNILKRGYSLSYRVEDNQRQLLKSDVGVKAGDRLEVMTDRLSIKADVVDVTKRAD